MFILIQGRVDARNGDTMVLDSVVGHRKTFEALMAFLSSGDEVIELAAAGTCHLCPDWPTLRTFRMVKNDGRLKTEEAPGGVLQVSGRPALLSRYAQEFVFDSAQDGAHRHPEYALAASNDLDPTSDSIIIEVDAAVAG